MSQKLILLGSSGMLGSALVKELASFELITPTRAELDITSEQAVRDIITKLKPAIVVNATAYTAVDQAENEEELATKINGLAVGYLTAACKEVSARLIHFSTDYVFDGESETGYDESVKEFYPINTYGRSKLAGEQAVRTSGCEFVIIRTSWLFGPVADPTKPDTKKSGRNFVDTMLRLGKERTGVADLSPLRIIVDQHGCPTYTVDLARATRELVKTGKTGIFHLTNSEPTTWADFAIEIFKQAKISVSVEKIPTSEYPTPAKRPKYGILLNTKRPKLRSWQEALADYLKKIGE